MEISAKKSIVTKLKTQCAVVFAFNTTLLKSGQELDKAHNGTLSKTLRSRDLEASAGNCAWITVPSSNNQQPYDRVLLVQLGKPEKTRTHRITRKNWNKIANSLCGALCTSSAKDAAVYIDDIELAEDTSPATRSLAKILAIAAVTSVYRYRSTKEKVEIPSLKKISLVTEQVASAKAGLAQGGAIGLGINTARELGNLPGNVCTPKYLADFAKSMATKHEKLSCKVLSEKQMAKLGMESLLSVAKGSEEEARLIIMEYRNGKTAGQKPQVLVGKGITFDSGGISLKPGQAMDEMKFDMCGAASVLGTLEALIKMNAPMNLIAIVAASENMPSGRANKPGDVVTSMSGQTIEVLNTDAEGRLVLCDALTYAERFKPKAVIDIATLTGACVIALGAHATGLFSNDDKLAQDLLEAGEISMDRAWRMPIWEEYQKQLDSNFADMANIGGRKAGSITAACFLSRFAKNFPWAHLDIAGTAWKSGGTDKGATGRPVGLLVEYLLNS